MAAYEYRPLDLGIPAIRLLQLLRGNFTDEIECSLFEGRINQADGGIPYDALSYVWGSTERAVKITVNSSTLCVTSNLYVALQHLRFQTKDRILWIDAICIDQDNMQERRHQVQQMSYIYKEAKCVIIWLGESTDESDLVMDFIKQLQNNNDIIEDDWRRQAEPRNHSLSTGRDGPEDMNKTQSVRWHKGMDLMLRRQWFRRVWILQEIANAQVAIVLCGKKSIPARSFAQALFSMGLEPDSHCQAVLDIMLQRKESWWTQNRNLHTLLVKFRDSEATDMRDIIYALLGISSDAYRSKILTPDYTKSLQQVIQDTTSFLLDHKAQDSSLYKFLDWSFREFLQNLDNLNCAVLGLASETGQEAVVKLLLATEEIELDWEDTSGRTPLQRAALNKHTAIVQLLLEKEAQLASTDIGMDWTPLQLATWKGHEATVRLLLEQDAQINSRDSGGRSLLILAAAKGQEVIVKLLFEGGAEVDSKDNKNRTPLWWAVHNGHEAIAKRIVKKDQVDVDLQTNYIEPTVSDATAVGHEAVVKLLLGTSQVDIDAKDMEFGQTPLWAAAEMGNKAVVKLLLENGADITVANSDGWTPLNAASYRGYVDVVKLLL
ncbi:ankyrin repeat-containing domain protein, partial [Leptodontidium sp. MPI-SDFR-AT-0119]